MRKIPLTLAITTAISANAQTFDVTTNPKNLSYWFLANAPAGVSGSGIALHEKARDWFTDIDGAQWMSASERAGREDAPGGGYIYSYFMDIETPGTYCLSGLYAADNRLQQITFNGSEVYANSSPRPIEAAQTIPFDAKNITVAAGVDQTLSFYIENGSSSGNPTSFIVKSTFAPCGESMREKPIPVDPVSTNSFWMLPISGDWNCDGVDTVGLYRRFIGRFDLWNTNVTYSGPPDKTVYYGPKRRKWLPAIGDWNGDGCDTLGLFDPTTETFYLKYDLEPGPADEMISR